MTSSKQKGTQDERQASLIPVIERAEQQLRRELEQVRHQADNRIRQAEMRAEQQIQEGRLGVSGLVEQRRTKGITELQKQAEQFSNSSIKRITLLQQQVKKNMAQAVQRVVEATTGVGGQT